MVSPMTRSPWRCSNPATTELSTPPDIATAMVSGIRGRQLSEMRDGFGNGLDQRVHLLDGIAAAQRKTQARFGLLASETDGSQDMRRLLRAAGAGRAARYRESAQIESDQQRLAVDAVESDVGRVGSARSAGPVDVRTGDAIQDSVFQAIAQCFQTRPLGSAVIDDPLCSTAQADRAGDIFSTRTPVALMMAAMHHRGERSSLADVQRADPLGRIKFVTGDGIHVDAQGRDVDWNFSGGLHAIRMHHRAGLARDLGDLR